MEAELTRRREQKEGANIRLDIYEQAVSHP
mgnify:FL=1